MSQIKMPLQGKAHAKIALAICDEQQMHIRSLTSPKNVWEELQRLYAPKDREINRTVADLSSIGDTIEDGDLAMSTLCVLSDDWDTVVSALCNLPEGDFKSATIKRRLLAEDARRRENTDSKSAMFLKDGRTSATIGKGTVKVKIKNNPAILHEFEAKNTLLVPEIDHEMRLHLNASRCTSILEKFKADCSCAQYNGS
ncbi:hypothetical protein CBL_09985 [Carabus blaptoides fortunei]